MAPQDIPGFYWDAEKNRYFKVENRKTAPANAAWSSDSVKRRKLEQRAAAERDRWAALNHNRIARSRALEHPLMGGFLAREHGENTRDVGAAGFALGLVEKGGIRFQNALTPANPTHMCVSNAMHEEACAVFATLDWYGLHSALALRNPSTGRVGERYMAVSSQVNLPDYTGLEPEISDIKYSEKIGRILVATRNIDVGSPVCALPPGSVGTFMRPRCFSRSGNRLYTGGRIDLNGLPHKHNLETNVICPAPASANYLCAVGTSHGLLLCDYENYTVSFRSPSGSHSVTAGRAGPHRDVFAVAYPSENPDILYFGGRPGNLTTADLRLPAHNYTSFYTGASITHVTPITEHQVLVSGLRDTLCVFDTRFCAPTTSSSSSSSPSEPSPSTRRSKPDRKTPHPPATPLLRFPGYKNGAYLSVGLAYDRASGVVAAAHDDGAVALYSARSGRRLASASRGLDGIKSPNGPVRCLQFDTFRGDAPASLFVPEGGAVWAYSFGKGELDEEG